MKRRKPHSQESRDRARVAGQRFYADPSVRAAHGAKTRYRMDRPEVRAKISERTKLALSDPRTNARKIAGLRRAFANPALRLKVSIQTKAGIEAKLQRQVLEMLEFWKAIPRKARVRFLERVGATAKPQHGKLGTIDLSAKAHGGTS